jgi:glucose-fructose oxidoreductase
LKTKATRIRYAVIGQGYFSQTAVLPAFQYAKNSELVALFSSDKAKLRELGRTYSVPHTLPYEAYDEFLSSGAVDAVYIVMPNSMHCDYTLRAARAGVHVLCEKPMAVSEAECEQMILACNEAQLKLMVAYRLHFEHANLEAIAIANSGKIGEPRLFNSLFSMQVKEGNSRVSAELGGGPLYDLGIYCINAARNIFRVEPLSVFAFKGTPDNEERFSEVDEHFGAVLRFPGDRIATFSTSFGAADCSQYDVIGTAGALRVAPAYDFDRALRHELTSGGKVTRRTFKKRDQVAPEIMYFSDCILNDVVPEPSGREGLADVRIIEALNESAQIGERVDLDPYYRKQRPDVHQERYVPAHGMPSLVHVDPPTQ